MLHYDPQSGVFRWRHERNNGKIKPWAIAGSKNGSGYVNIVFGEKPYKAHRLAFLYMTGEFPALDVDHADGIKDNNSWSNLRQATNSQNKWNVGLRKDNKSGAKGVRFDKSLGKWRVDIKVQGIQKYVGVFVSYEDACKVAHQFRSEHHGEFAKH